jgi:hypothetical protein
MGQLARKKLTAKDAEKAQRAQRKNVEGAMIIINANLKVRAAQPAFDLTRAVGCGDPTAR